MESLTSITGGNCLIEPFPPVSRRRKPFSSIAPFMFTMMPELNWFCVLTHFWLWQFIGVSFAIGWRRHLDRWCCLPSW